MITVRYNLRSLAATGPPEGHSYETGVVSYMGAYRNQRPAPSGLSTQGIMASMCSEPDQADLNWQALRIA